MTVIKKSGRKEEFSERKLASSIKAANEKTEEIINCDSIVYEIVRIVRWKD
ncbi:MAG: ATP cone domain-containing protein [Oscillospiraceae bacterium]